MRVRMTSLLAWMPALAAFLALLLPSCAGISLPFQATPTVDGFEPTARAFEFLDARAACQASAECALMPVGGCGNIQAIHQSQVDLANRYTEYSRTKYPDVVCAPNLPLEEYEALCLNRQCIEVIRRSHMLIEVPEQPVLGKPFWVGMSVRFYNDAERIEVRVNLPQGVSVTGGEVEWSGPLKAGEDHVLWVQAQANATGKYYLSGWAGVKDGSSSISPLNSGRYITVILESEVAPLPQAERIIATPTPVK